MVKNIRLKNMEDICKLHDEAAKYYGDVGVHSDSTIVDAKSLLGLMSLDLSKPLVCVSEDKAFYRHINSLLVG